jgi:uncharacterized protein YcaQ
LRDVRTISMTALQRLVIGAQGGYATRARRGSDSDVEETIRASRVSNLDSVTATRALGRYPELAEEVGAALHERGPLTSRDFEGRRGGAGMWNWKPAKMVLEALWNLASSRPVATDCRPRSSRATVN